MMEHYPLDAEMGDRNLCDMSSSQMYYAVDDTIA